VFALTRLRLPIVVIVGFVFAVLLALAVFSSAEAAEQDGATKEKADAANEQTDAATTEGTVPEDSEGPITIEQHSWGNYHWARTANPFTLKLGDNVTSAWDAYLVEASSDWTKSSVLDTTKVAGQSSARRCPATTGRVEVCNANYGQNGWLGVASIWATGGHITKGTTKLNDSYFTTAKYNTPDWRRLVMCQEIGHTFGLGHQDENFSNGNLDTCMDYTNNPATNGHPNAHDYEQLESIYSHLDSSTTIAQTSDTSTGTDKEPGDGPRAWGTEKFRSEDGQFSVFEKNLGNDNKKITHVFWTEERAKEHRGKEEKHEG
jgi:hypothetical protein